MSVPFHVTHLNLIPSLYKYIYFSTFKLCVEEGTCIKTKVAEREWKEMKRLSARQGRHFVVAAHAPSVWWPPCPLFFMSPFTRPSLTTSRLCPMSQNWHFCKLRGARKNKKTASKRSFVFLGFDFFAKILSTMLKISLRARGDEQSCCFCSEKSHKFLLC